MIIQIMIVKSFSILQIQDSSYLFENSNNYLQNQGLLIHFLSKYKQLFFPRNHILISLNDKALQL